MLYLIPTPIWNKEDITLRTLNLFKELKYLICEDTRNTKKLLWMYEIDYSDKEFYSLTSFTNQGKLNHYLNILKENNVGLVSDAGTPWLSDPGKIMIQLCAENNIQYTTLPWANALVPAIVGSVFDTSKFVYLGFLPTKKWRQTIFKEILTYDKPVFFYESVHRIEKTLKELKEYWFQWQVSISREISKMFEQLVTWTIDEIIEMVNNKQILLKWEFVIWVKNEWN